MRTIVAALIMALALIACTGATEEDSATLRECIDRVGGANPQMSDSQVRAICSTGE